MTDASEWIPRVRERLGGLAISAARGEEIVEELAQHLADRCNEARAAGASKEEADRLALEELADGELTRELLRSVRRTVEPIPLGASGGRGLVADVWQDLRYSIRMLVKSPGFAALSVLALALGIGANTAIFSVIDSILLHPLPFEDLDSLLLVSQHRAPSGGHEIEMAPGNYVDLRDQSELFEQVAAWAEWDVNLAGAADAVSDGEPERVQGFLVAPSFFAALRVEPSLGRTFRPEEDQPGHDRVVVISHVLWRDRFASNPGVLGDTVRLNSVPHTIVGVMPERFQFPPGWPELWAPLTLNAAEQQSRALRYLRVLARMRPGVTRQQVSAEMTALGSRLAKEHPDTNGGWAFSAAPLVGFVVRFSRPVLLSLLWSVAFVLLIACANVANLLLMRALSRQKEIAIRTAIGASRLRVVRQLLTESLVLSLLAGMAGLFVALWGIDLARGSMPPEVIRFVPGWADMAIGTRVLIFTLGLSLLTGVLFGLVPALQASRPDINETLKESGRQWTRGQGRHRLRGVLVVLEIAMAMVLLIGASLSIRGFGVLLTENLGLRPDHLLTAQISHAPADDPSPEEMTGFYRRILDRVAALPGVESAATVSNLPMSGNWQTSGIRIEGKPEPPPAERPSVLRYHVSPGYFATMGIPLRLGRDFTAQDDEHSVRVGIVSQRLARRFWPGEDPIGKGFAMAVKETGEGWVTVVGVVDDVRHFGLDAEPRPTMYFPYAQTPRATMTLMARVRGEPMSLASPLREAVHEVDAGQPVYNIRTMEAVISDAVAGPRFSMGLLGILAMVALFLSAIGIYGVMSSAVSQRTHEIGVRVAFGATRRDVLAMTLGQGLKLTLIGVAIGVTGAYGLARLISSAVFWVRPTDPLAFTAIPLLLALVAMLAVWLPALHATRVDPMVALRHE
jgi:putative ABC transport system permease protein